MIRRGDRGEKQRRNVRQNCVQCLWKLLISWRDQKLIGRDRRFRQFYRESLSSLSVMSATSKNEEFHREWAFLLNKESNSNCASNEDKPTNGSRINSLSIWTRHWNNEESFIQNVLCPYSPWALKLGYSILD